MSSQPIPEPVADYIHEISHELIADLERMKVRSIESLAMVSFTRGVAVGLQAALIDAEGAITLREQLFGDEAPPEVGREINVEALELIRHATGAAR